MAGEMGGVGMPQMLQQNREASSVQPGTMGGMAGSQMQRRDPYTPEQLEQQRIYKSLAYKFPEAQFDDMGNITNGAGGTLGPGYYVNQIKNDLKNQQYTMTKSALAEYGVDTRFTDGSMRQIYFPGENEANAFFKNLTLRNGQNIGNELLSSGNMTSQYSAQPVKL